VSLVGIAFIALIFISIFQFAVTAKRHGLKVARREADEYAGGGAFFLSLITGMIIFIYLIDLFIPKSERWPSAVIYCFIFIWVWERICSWIADFFSE
jgi:hypothetical protein